MNKKALFVATVSGFLDSFEISDISLLQSLGYQVHCACNLRGETSDSDQARLRATGAVLHQIDFTRSPLSAANRGAYRQLKRLMAEESFDLVHCAEGSCAAGAVYGPWLSFFSWRAPEKLAPLLPPGADDVPLYGSADHD